MEDKDDFRASQNASHQLGNGETTSFPVYTSGNVINLSEFQVPQDMDLQPSILASEYLTPSGALDVADVTELASFRTTSMPKLFDLGNVHVKNGMMSYYVDSGQVYHHKATNKSIRTDTDDLYLMMDNLNPPLEQMLYNLEPVDDIFKNGTDLNCERNPVTTSGSHIPLQSTGLMRPNLPKKRKLLTAPESNGEEKLGLGMPPSPGGLENGETDSAGEESGIKCKRTLPHKKRISKLSNDLKCNKCDQEFVSLTDFNSHQNKHAYTIYTCELCKKMFANQLLFFEHLKTHYEPKNKEPKMEDGKDLYCHACDKTYSSENDYQKHVFDVHVAKQHDFQMTKGNDFHIGKENDFSIGKDSDFPIGKDNFPMEKDNDFPIKNNDFSIVKDNGFPISKENGFEIGKESDFHIDKEREKYSVQPPKNEKVLDIAKSVLEKSSDFLESDLDEEVLTPELEIDMIAEEALEELGRTDSKYFAYQCETCNKLCSSRETLRSHKEDVHKPKKKSGPVAACTECGKVFQHRNSLTYHMRSHRNERPHHCAVCGRSFFAAGALRVHQRLHTGQKPYKCDECGRLFRQWGDLKYHRVSIHSGVREFQCEFCGKEFARKYSLVVHRRIHTGEKDYKCEVCSKAFRAATYLQNHRRIHTGEKPYMCEVCGKSFRVRSDMKRHMHTHQKEVSTPATTTSSNTLLTDTSLLQLTDDSTLVIAEDINGTASHDLMLPEMEPKAAVYMWSSSFING